MQFYDWKSKKVSPKKFFEIRASETFKTFKYKINK